MNQDSLSREEIQALRALGTPHIANAIEAFGVRLRNEGYSDSTIQCMFPGLPPTVGYAATIKVRSSDPPTNGSIYLEHTDWWDHILTIPEPRLLAIQDCDDNAGRAAFLGEVHASILQALGCVGVVTNGAVRDLAEVRAMQFQLFAGGASVSHAYMHVVQIGGPVEIGGLKIHPGNLLAADCHGVLSVPAELGHQIPAVAARIAADEQRIISLCRSQTFSVSKLRALVRELRAKVN